MKKTSKVNTAILPTPLHKLDNVSKDLKKNIYIKRDDMTGIGLGGNKLRKLDYIVAKAKEEGYTTLLTYGGAQTNHGRLTAAAAAKFGMKSIIMAYGRPPKNISGNLVLDRLIGTEVVFIDTSGIKEKAKGKSHDEVVELYREKKSHATNTIIQKYEDQGEKVYVIQIGGHSKEGLLGYFYAIDEIQKQEKELGIKFDSIVVGNGSGGTLGGLLLGNKYFNANYKIYSSNISEIPEEQFDRLISFCNETSNYYEMGVNVTIDDFEYTNKYVGIGYNIPDKETRDAIYYMASKEGIFLDPCYTGKSFMGLLGLHNEGKFNQDENILYIHTGGMPALWTEEHEESFNEELWNDIEVF